MGLAAGDSRAAGWEKICKGGGEGGEVAKNPPSPHPLNITIDTNQKIQIKANHEGIVSLFI